jgi:hypothetical protein
MQVDAEEPTPSQNCRPLPSNAKRKAGNSHANGKANKGPRHAANVNGIRTTSGREETGSAYVDMAMEAEWSD